MLKVIFRKCIFYVPFEKRHFFSSKVILDKVNSSNLQKLKTLPKTIMPTCFNEKSDMYQGVSIDSKDIGFSGVEFDEKLAHALLSWTESGVRGIWFKVNLNDSSLIPLLIKNGFVFHHAKPSYAMLTKWLPKDEINSLPQFPHTHIGVGGLVINNQNEVLVIQERFQSKPHWKLPGGYSNPGEEIWKTAQREVLEETGVETEFVSLVSLRHHHKHIFECSDIYIVCYMRPQSCKITPNEEEIALCQWMDINVYATHPDVTDFNRFVMNAFLESRRLKAAIMPTQVLSFNKTALHSVYTVKPSNTPDKK